MIILRQKNYSRFDLTPEEQEIWEKSIKRDGRKPKLKELIQQAKKYKCSDEFIHKLTTVIDMLRRDQVVIGIDVLRLKFKVAFDVLMKNRGTS